jgi:two-component SAPR family response regulator
MDGFDFMAKISKMDNKIKACFLTAAQEYYDKYRGRYPLVPEEWLITNPITLENIIR